MLVTCCNAPTASVRSECDFHALLPTGCAARDGESRGAGVAVVKDTILELEQMNSVSMPSELLVEAGADGALLVRVGTVKLRRALVGIKAGGACERVLDAVGDDMLEDLCRHSRRCSRC